MAEEQLFRTSLHGFNKDDVISYIDGLNRTAAENQEWFEKQSKAMADTIKRLNKENSELKESAGDGSAAQKLKEATTQIAQLRARLSKREAELKAAAERISELEQLQAQAQPEVQSEAADEVQKAESNNAEYEAVVKKNETLTASLRQACQRIYDEQQKNANLTQKLGILANKIKEMQGQAPVRTQAEAPAVDNSAEVEELRTQVALLQQQLADAQNEKHNEENAEVQRLRDELAETQSQAAAQIEELTAQTRQLTSRLTLLQAQANANAQTARVSAAGVYTPVATLEQDVKLNERIRMLEDQTKRLESENDRLRLNAHVSQDELQILQDKARLYDDIKNNVARIVDDARKKAAEMIREAEISSRETMESGTAVLNQMQRRIRTMQDEIDVARKVYNDSTLSMAGMLNGLEDSISITDNHLIAILGTQNND